MHALITERILTGMFLGKQGENYMIKDNQKSLNRFHVVLDVLESLPKEMDIPEGMEDEGGISDYISDQTGWCHFGFELDPEIE